MLGNYLQSSDYVSFENNIITINLLSYEFKSKYGVVFIDKNIRLRVKFETVSLDGDDLYFDLYLDPQGRIYSDYNSILDKNYVDILERSSVKSIDKYISEFVYNFLSKNSLI
ncbi:hypothetical protein AL553_010810 [Vibrio alginolyticus]|uniref:Uncharacterized protein n=2 Tax=Vibrio TaxID=662 RepID=A0ABX4XA69_VIBAL|nr:hypothetical protein AL545_16415 [Vibrio alginolyticus]AVF70606.1 hypothetical protein AL545_16550 [Vibrio alginolyticus]AVF70620.1 hypothetical protein AL545_16620 [Vibrio alginolyticus]PNP20782.1 hypothetical protein AL553_024490 [Vibrio alginolyticus]PNP26907.1 hypothetical protein AL553_010810 [Vibrio alginolyticus]